MTKGGKKPEVLLLEEATSNATSALDAEIEKAFQAAINRIVADKCMIHTLDDDHHGVRAHSATFLIILAHHRLFAIP